MTTRPVRFKPAAIPRDPGSMPWVQVAPGGRYFQTEDGAPFLVIGHNEAMPWPYMHALKGERDIATTESYLRMLVEHGVTVIRIMLEYNYPRGWHFEKPLGRPAPAIIQYWDNLVGLCERYKLRLLLTFWDTFFMSRRWQHHAYSAPASGFDAPGSFCTSPAAMEWQKARIAFVIDRWGDSPAIFAYDLLNEIHPHWGGAPEEQARWVTAMARFTRDRELARWGKRHLLTVSIFGHKPEGGYLDLILRHPELDFVTTHVYEFGVVDNPANTVDGALTMRAAVRFALDHMTPVRPYTDTESGPIHAFMDLRRLLPEAFDDEYYHNMSWAHLATGGAGSGMRWPFRRPHTLTPGMHAVQAGMARFVHTLAWVHFTPRPVDEQLAVLDAGGPGDDPAAGLPILPFGCSDGRQALVWLLRDTRIVGEQDPLPPAHLHLPGLAPGAYVAEFWETYSGTQTGAVTFHVPAPTDGDHVDQAHSDAPATTIPLPPFGRDLAIAIKPLPGTSDAESIADDP